MDDIDSFNESDSSSPDDDFEEVENYYDDNKSEEAGDLEENEEEVYDKPSEMQEEDEKSENEDEGGLDMSYPGLSKRAKMENSSEFETGGYLKTSEGKNESNTSGYGPKMSFGEKIMGKFGHERGRGLGKHSQGIVEPVKASEQIGKRGLGFHQTETIEINEELECIQIEETPVWLNNPYPYNDIPSEDQLEEWEKRGPMQKDFDKISLFCDQEIFESLIDAKNELDSIDRDVIKKTAKRSNPFETIRAGIFLNRAAMKMANMDRVFDYMFTNPKNSKDEPIVGPNELLYFADVCAGPGGFSEYVLHRKNWRAKGFGFTLKKSNDFLLDKFLAGPSETFEAYYGEDEDGDVFKSNNIESFKSFVMESTDNLGVHFMMSDGGFEISKGERQIQEILSKQLYLCQCLVALNIVRTGGNFVTKLFDLFTPFSVGLIYLMYRCFDRISLHKPNSSRPANSERYLICQWKRQNCEDVIKHFFRVNKVLNKKKEDVLELVPLHILREDSQFFEYVRNSNNRIGKRQSYHLKNIEKYHKKLDLTDLRQADFRERCLRYWNIRDETRSDKRSTDPVGKVKALLRDDGDFLYNNGSNDLSMLEKLLHLDWYWMFTEFGDTGKKNDFGSEKGMLTFYLGLGRSNVFRLENRNWKNVDVKDFQLPRDTLVYGEMVEEVQNPEKPRGQLRSVAFHIVDCLFLGGEDLRGKSLGEREKCGKLFAKALTKVSKMTVRMKNLMPISSFPELNLKLINWKRKNGKDCKGYYVQENTIFVPRNVIFLNAINEPWVLKKSRKNPGKYYYWHSKKNKSVWSREVEDDTGLTQEIFANFRSSFTKRLIWSIDDYGDSQFVNLSHEINKNQME